MPKKPSYQNAIAHFRKKRKLSQKELAWLIDCSVATLRRWEAEKANPTIDNAMRLAIALKTPIADLFREQTLHWRKVLGTGRPINKK